MERPSGPLVLPILLGCHRTSDGAWEPWKVQKTQTMEVKLGRWVQYCDIYLYTHFLPSLHLVRLFPALNFKGAGRAKTYFHCRHCQAETSHMMSGTPIGKKNNSCKVVVRKDVYGVLATLPVAFICAFPSPALHLGS
jgi:hypothetical protein